MLPSCLFSHLVDIQPPNPNIKNSQESAAMVCVKCEMKQDRETVPSEWKEGTRMTNEIGGHKICLQNEQARVRMEKASKYLSTVWKVSNKCPGYNVSDSRYKWANLEG